MRRHARNRWTYRTQQGTARSRRRVSSVRSSGRNAPAHSSRRERHTNLAIGPIRDGRRDAPRGNLAFHRASRNEPAAISVLLPAHEGAAEYRLQGSTRHARRERTDARIRLPCLPEHGPSLSGAALTEGPLRTPEPAASARIPVPKPDRVHL